MAGQPCGDTPAGHHRKTCGSRRSVIRRGDEVPLVSTSGLIGGDRVRSHPQRQTSLLQPQRPSLARAIALTDNCLSGFFGKCRTDPCLKGKVGELSQIGVIGGTDVRTGFQWLQRSLVLAVERAGNRRLLVARTRGVQVSMNETNQSSGETAGFGAHHERDCRSRLYAQLVPVADNLHCCSSAALLTHVRTRSPDAGSAIVVILETSQFLRRRGHRAICPM